MLNRVTKKLANGMNVTASKSGLGVSMPIGKKARITKRANGKMAISINLGNGLRFTKNIT